MKTKRSKKSKNKEDLKEDKNKGESKSVHEKKIRIHENHNSDRIKELKENSTEAVSERNWRYPWEAAWKEGLEVRWK